VRNWGSGKLSDLLKVSLVEKRQRPTRVRGGSPYYIPILLLYYPDPKGLASRHCAKEKNEEIRGEEAVKPDREEKSFLLLKKRETPRDCKSILCRMGERPLSSPSVRALASPPPPKVKVFCD
jgi:hypothetical protein